MRDLNYDFGLLFHTILLVHFQPTPVILLKEGTDSSQGVPQLISNINACQVRKTVFFPPSLFISYTYVLHYNAKCVGVFFTR